MWIGFFLLPLVSCDVILWRSKSAILSDVDVDTRIRHVHRVFAGAAGVMLPCIVLAGERIGCLLRYQTDVDSLVNEETGEFEVDKFCRNIYLGTDAIMSSIVFTFSYASMFLVKQLTEKEKSQKLTVRKVITMDLSNSNLAQVVLLGIGVLIAILLYEVREEGEVRPGFNLFLFSVYIIWLTVAILAMLESRNKSSGDGKQLFHHSSSLDEKIASLSQSSRDLSGAKNKRRKTTGKKRGTLRRTSSNDDGDVEGIGRIIMNLNPEQF